MNWFNGIQILAYSVKIYICWPRTNTTCLENGNIYISTMIVCAITWKQNVILTGFRSGVPPGGVAEEMRFSLWAILLLGCLKALFSSLMLAWCFCITSSGLSKNCYSHSERKNRRKKKDSINRKLLSLFLVHSTMKSIWI